MADISKLKEMAAFMEMWSETFDEKWKAKVAGWLVELNQVIANHEKMIINSQYGKVNN